MLSIVASVSPWLDVHYMHCKFLKGKLQPADQRVGLGWVVGFNIFGSVTLGVPLYYQMHGYGGWCYIWVGGVICGWIWRVLSWWGSMPQKTTTTAAIIIIIYLFLISKWRSIFSIIKSQIEMSLEAAPRGRPRYFIGREYILHPSVLTKSQILWTLPTWTNFDLSRFTFNPDIASKQSRSALKV